MCCVFCVFCGLCELGFVCAVCGLFEQNNGNHMSCVLSCGVVFFFFLMFLCVSL